MKTVSLTITLLFLFLSALPLQAEDKTDVAAIIDQANLTSYYQGQDGRADVTLTITDNQGRVREREMTILRRDVTDGGEQQFYVFFKRPSDVRKMTFLVHKKTSGDDDRWLYLPALDLVKRIASSDKRTSFVGSHFFYEDVSGRAIHEDEHQLIETTDQYYVINNTPKDPGSVEFTSYTVWIDKTNSMPMKAEYRNTAGNVYREVEVLEVQDIQGYPTVTKSRIRDLESGGETVSSLSNIGYDISLKESIFTERFLRRPPREVR
ncbi:MAG: outer membrane lipoprotein-sorting protein [Desulfobulbaceae bacterium]|uniref:Outer membrane lipoprotein-sorting protein n=1 Tax=Candidatus Desulfatifera sulfidica TaxID=2841691 RepID=A0A8J6TE64_9BACT|nr:outer membrane lipoprotein-sorting protein [Candidatus Desulfatifera sulfidica]